tara:strand:+ start:1012 stop:1233 length:222 start_codon:yes stop_codon:yes gene_type:complete
MMEIFRMNKKGYLAESDPEVDCIYKEWLKRFKKARAIGKEIEDAEVRFAKANAEFLEVHHYWEAYEKENGASR